jgi:hypothetical protein
MPEVDQRPTHDEHIERQPGKDARACDDQGGCVVPLTIRDVAVVLLAASEFTTDPS